MLSDTVGIITRCHALVTYARLITERGVVNRMSCDQW